MSFIDAFVLINPNLCYCFALEFNFCVYEELTIKCSVKSGEKKKKC